MNGRCSLFLVAFALALVTPAGAQDDLEGRFTLAFQGGTDSELAGNVLSAINGRLFDLEVITETLKYRDIYEPSFRGQVLIGFGVTGNGEIIARVSHYKMESPGGVAAGTVAGDPLFAFLDPYEEWGAELGYRFYIASRTRLKSYVAPVAGVRFLDRILLGMSAPDRGSSISNVPHFDASTIAVFGVDMGFTFDLTPNFYVGLEAELRYQPKPTAATTAPGLAGINGEGSRWSAPIVATVGLRF